MHCQHGTRFARYSKEYVSISGETVKIVQNSNRENVLRHIAAAFGLTSLVLFFPANLLPFMSFETMGQESSPTIFEGIRSLYESGSLFLAIIVFLASMVLPLLKIIVVLVLLSPLGKKLKPTTFRSAVVVFDTIGRWAMLDVFLLAIFVAIMKFGSVGRSMPEMGAVLFSIVVIATMLSYTAMEKIVTEKGELKHA